MKDQITLSKAELFKRYKQKIVSDINQHGFAIIFVRPESGAPPYAYTSGLGLKLKHPDILISGLPFREAQTHLNNIVREIKAGISLRPFDKDDGLIEDRNVTYIPVNTTEHADDLFTNCAIYRGNSFKMLQAVYSNAAGLFPWEAVGSESYSQTLFGKPAEGQGPEPDADDAQDYISPFCLSMS